MDPSVFLKAQARFARISRVRLVLPSIALAALWLFSRGGALSPEEAALWRGSEMPKKPFPLCDTERAGKTRNASG